MNHFWANMGLFQKIELKIWQNRKDIPPPHLLAYFQSLPYLQTLYQHYQQTPSHYDAKCRRKSSPLVSDG